MSQDNISDYEHAISGISIVIHAILNVHDQNFRQQCNEYTKEFLNREHTMQILAPNPYGIQPETKKIIESFLGPLD